MGFDSLLFGDAGITPRTQLLALPPAEVTAILHDLVEEIECDLPYQIIMMNDSLPPPPPSHEGVGKAVPFVAVTEDIIVKEEEEEAATAI
jgi:hypothetical protein